MKDYIEERAVEIAGYIVETKATVRQAAKKFGISKSTVHKLSLIHIYVLIETLWNVKIVILYIVMTLPSINRNIVECKGRCFS